MRLSMPDVALNSWPADEGRAPIQATAQHLLGRRGSGWVSGQHTGMTSALHSMKQATYCFVVMCHCFDETSSQSRMLSLACECSTHRGLCLQGRDVHHCQYCKQLRSQDMQVSVESDCQYLAVAEKQHAASPVCHINRIFWRMPTLLTLPGKAVCILVLATSMGRTADRAWKGVEAVLMAGMEAG